MAIVTTDNQHYADIADAIRGKGVNGEFMPSEMAEAIADISTGVDIDVKSAVKCETITVGANSVTNPVAALEYFGYTAPFPQLTIIALDVFTVNNEFGYSSSREDSSSPSWWRWRDNSVVWPNTFNTSWDARLTEGAKYLVIEW